MDSEPDHTETSSSKQANSFEVFRKAFSKLVVLVSSEVGFNIEITLISVAIVDLDSFLLVVLGLADVIISFLQATQFFFGFRILLFSSIK